MNTTPLPSLENLEFKDTIKLTPATPHKQAPVMTVSDFTGDVDETEIDSNPFPTDVFPEIFKRLIIESNQALNFPTDYTGAAIIAAVSTAIGKSAKLEVKNKWDEYPGFFLGIIGAAGANKSHPIDLAFRPFHDIDRANIQRFEAVYKAYEAFLNLPKNEKDQKLAPEKPKLVKTILHNFTPEILYQRMTDNDRGCTVVSEELATFLQGMNNYSKGDQTSNYLSIWSNKNTSVDRVKSPVPLWLPQPFLTIIGGLQKRILPNLFPENKTANGFIQRFLFACPDSTDKQPINDNVINDSVLFEYTKWIYDYISENAICFNAETGLPRAKRYWWSDMAKRVYYEWQKNNTDLVNDNPDSLKGEILSKFDIHFPRLALVLQIMEDYKTDEISQSAAEGAAKLCSYFIKCSMKVLSILKNTNPITLLPADKQRIYSNLPLKFTTQNGVEIALRSGMAERTFKRFLNNEEMFSKNSRGEYEKRFL